jgi:hypothetical protein
MSCVSFLSPFLENVVSGGLATSVNSMKYSSAQSSPFSSLFSTADRKSSKQKPSYQMENLSEVGLNDSGIFGKSESNTNGSYTETPSINNDEIRFAPANTNYHGDLGPLRPDKVLNFSRVSNPPVEENQARSPRRGKMVITRTRQWDVQKEDEQAKGEDRDSEP